MDRTVKYGTILEPIDLGVLHEYADLWNTREGFPHVRMDAWAFL